MIPSIIGFILCLVAIFILKKMYYKPWHGSSPSPALRMWHVIALGTSSLIPLWNFIVGASMLIIIPMMFADDYYWTEKCLPLSESRLIRFLNKRIS